MRLNVSTQIMFIVDAFYTNLLKKDLKKSFGMTISAFQVELNSFWWFPPFECVTTISILYIGIFINVHLLDYKFKVVV